MKLDRSRTALLFLDLLNDIAHPAGKLSPPDRESLARYRNALGAAKHLLDAARAESLRVIHVAVRYRPGYPDANEHMPLVHRMRETGALVEGTPGADFLQPFAPQGGEAVVVKRGISAFTGSDLDRLLRNAGVDTLVLCGISTCFAVEGTAREALDRGYRVLVAADACAADRADRHSASIDVLGALAEVRMTSDLAKALGAGVAEIRPPPPPPVASTAVMAPAYGAPPAKADGAIGAVKLKARAVLSQEAPSAPPTLVADQNEIIQVFKTFDVDGNNFIDRSEFQQLCSALGVRFAGDQFEEAFNSVDIDGNGVIDFNEFMRWWYANQD